MVRLYVIVEGHSEQSFVKRLLAPHLGAHGVFAEAQRITTLDERRNVGGREVRQLERGSLLHYRQLRRDVENYPRRRDVWLTTFMDLYRLPQSFPGYAACAPMDDPFARADALEAAISADLQREQLIPYIQVHEFESLLFTDLNKLRSLCENERDERALHRLAKELAGLEPERINGGAETHPYARIFGVFGRRYQKRVDGPNLLHEIGLPTLLERAPRFAAWVRRLEGLARGPR